MAALFHDYDPLKQFDKPHEDSVERFLRNDKRIKKFIDDVGINIDIVIAIIHRYGLSFQRQDSPPCKKENARIIHTCRSF